MVVFFEQRWRIIVESGNFEAEDIRVPLIAERVTVHNTDGVTHPRVKITPDHIIFKYVFASRLGLYQQENSPDSGSSITSPETNTSFPLCFVYPVRGGSHSASPADGITRRANTKTVDTETLFEFRVGH